MSTKQSSPEGEILAAMVQKGGDTIPCIITLQYTAPLCQCQANSCRFAIFFPLEHPCAADIAPGGPCRHGFLFSNYIQKLNGFQALRSTSQKLNTFVISFHQTTPAHSSIRCQSGSITHTNRPSSISKELQIFVYRTFSSVSHSNRGAQKARSPADGQGCTVY